MVAVETEVRTVSMQAVCILLECFLGFFVFCFFGRVNPPQNLKTGNHNQEVPLNAPGVTPTKNTRYN